MECWNLLVTEKDFIPFGFTRHCQNYCESVAVEEHLKIIRQGVAAWNLSGANLSGAHLSGKADLSAADLSGAFLSRTAPVITKSII
jgi:hypothetical protein